MAVHRGHGEQPPPPLQQADTDPSATLCIIYTSGTTGAPKGVLFSHRMLRIATEAALMVTGARAGDRLFLWEPLCHVGGAQMLLTPFMADVQLHIVPAFSASRFWDQVARAGATHLHYLGGVVDILLQVPATIPDRHTLKVAWGAGLGVKTWKAAERALGVLVHECYGMTECSSFTTFNAEGRPGSIGRPLPWFEVELLDAAGKPVAVGEHGEVVVTSRIEGAFLRGYLNNPEATRDALKEGRFHTGDSAWRDADGFLYFVGRRTDSMRVRGENVSAWEVERAFAHHPAVSRSAAIGVAGAVGEQDILLYLCPKDGRLPKDSSAVSAELARWAAEHLASYQVPRYYKWIDRFELTPSERIRKHLLSRDLAGSWDRVAGAVVGGIG
jgi:crotonobetaine/carnitine-CoA ligase